MKFIPILFSTPMVQSIQKLIKKMTRRTKGLEKINESPDDWYFTNCTASCEDKKEFYFKHRFYEGDDCDLLIPCPYGKVGDVLWVRETWAGHMHFNPKGYSISDIVNSSLVEPKFYYLATKPEYGPIGRWRPNIHMPKTACRLFLQITDIRVERLQDISEEDGKAEGVLPFIPMREYLETLKALGDYVIKRPHGEYKNAFMHLWVNINGATSWKANPWVWVISFKQINKPENFC